MGKEKRKAVNHHKWILENHEYYMTIKLLEVRPFEILFIEILYCGLAEVYGLDEYLLSLPVIDNKIDSKYL